MTTTSGDDIVLATPSKDFFIAMLTRDIGIVDAILDLVDNAVGKAVETAHYDVIGVLLDEPRRDALSGPQIDIEVANDTFRISDTAGGISIHEARTEIFLFGNPAADHDDPGLSVYGIGMKRAFFKLGRKTTFASGTRHEQFRVDIDARLWAADPKWELQFADKKYFTRARTQGVSTDIRITELSPSARDRFSDPTFAGELQTTISWAYALFLQAGLVIRVNGVPVSGYLPRLASGVLQPGRFLTRIGSVDVLIVAGIAPKEDVTSHGWYVFCNGRMVLRADRTVTTGWGDGLPLFHPGKHRRFLGFVYFRSTDVDALPWRTTKQGVDTDSSVYRAALREMQVQARPVLQFLNDLYPSDAEADPLVERDFLQRAPTETLADAAKREATFSRPVLKRSTSSSTVSIQYRRPKALVERVRVHLGERSLSASRVGEVTFDRFLDDIE